MMHDYWWRYDMMDGAGWLLLLLGFLAAVSIILLIVWAVRSASGRGEGTATPPQTGAPSHDEAVAIARRRLASGEITKEQYDEIMSTLGG